MMLSIGFAHADITSTTIVKGPVVEEFGYKYLEVDDGGFNFYIQLNDDMLGTDLEVGAVITLTGVDTNGDEVSVTHIATNPPGNIVEADEIFEAYGFSLDPFNYSEGDTFTLRVEGTIDGGVTTDLAKYGGEEGLIVTVYPPTPCGYETLSSIDYGTLSKDASGTVISFPIINDGPYIQPTGITFSVGNWTNSDGDDVVYNTNTLLNGTSGNDTDISFSVDSNTVFNFTHIMEFPDTNTYVSNIGNTLTQTTTVATTCE